MSVGVYEGAPVLDLDYAEDSACDTDMNVVMTGSGGLVEVQGTAEGAPFSREELDAMLGLAREGHPRAHRRAARRAGKEVTAKTQSDAIIEPPRRQEKQAGLHRRDSERGKTEYWHQDLNSVSVLVFDSLPVSAVR